ncbi:MAG: HPF/RaiA family ribosome-associated protein [Bacteroidota bacterium]|nr:HPF/RaiA family ribosome-associated protein [Bacteroidota bacterium]
MNITISSIHFDADSKLELFIKERISKLIKKYDGILGSEVILKLENTTTTENKVAEIKLLIPGNDLFVKKQAKTFEESTDLALEALSKQLIKRKEKIKGI